MSERSLAGALAHGAIAGVIGASCMTVLRMLAHRAGWVEQMVPQAVEAWAERDKRLPAQLVPRSLAARHVVDELLHFAYGASWGGLFGVLRTFTRAGGPVSTAAFGVGQWAFGAAFLFPALEIGKPPWRSDARENSVNIAAHLLYASVTSFLVEEFARQERDQPRTYMHSLRARVG